MNIRRIITTAATLLFPIAQATEEKRMPVESEIPPSRFIGPNQIEDHIQLLGSRFAMNTRERDVFGKPIIPKPIIPKPSIIGDHPFPFRKPDFASVIQRIRVTSIMPDGGSFMIGDRRFKKGDRIPIRFKSFTYQVEVASVTAKQVDFINVETGEVASLTLDLRPVY